jgi:hypothetical protein
LDCLPSSLGEWGLGGEDGESLVCSIALSPSLRFVFQLLHLPLPIPSTWVPVPVARVEVITSSSSAADA